MARLIDADILIAELKESALHHCNNPREDSLLQRDRVIVRAQPTVEAIPKDQYEARLKADMVADYKDIQAEIRRFMYDVNPSSSESDYACNYMIDIIQQKINSLKAESEEV